MGANQVFESKAALAQESDSDTELRPRPLPAPEVPTDRHLVRSVLWSAAGDWGTQLFTWLSFLEVMRLLTPADFGIAGMAGILMPYMGQLTGLGLPRAVVALNDLSEDQLAQMNTLSLISATCLFILGIAVAKPFAAFFRTPALAPVFILACSGLVLSALCGVPNAKLTKAMRFRMLSILGVACTLTSAVVTLGLAWMGFKYWALLLGNMVAGVVRTAVILRARPTRLAWPRLKSIREPLRFGWQISVSLVAMNSYQRLDNFVAARMLGATALGFYANAWEIANIPIEKIASLFTTVIPSYLAVVQDQPSALRRYLRGLTEVIALGTFPTTVGLALVAHEFVPIVFGHNWEGMIGPLQVLSFYAGFRSIVALLSKMLIAVGNVRYVMWNDLAALVILPVAFYFGSRRGTVGIAWGWVVAYPFIVLPLYRKTFQAIDMSIGEYLKALRPALTGTLVMIPIVEWARYSSPPTLPLIARLVIEVSAGAVAYMATLFLLHRDRLAALFRTAKQLLASKKPAPMDA
jgi:PST family polysaccharide transporter